MAGGSFRTSAWNPTLIVGQIICMQSAFYSAESTLMFLWSLMNTEFSPTLALIFGAQALKPLALIQLAASFCCALLLPYLVGRSRQCLDFAVTLHIIHLVAVCIYNRAFPTQLSWWLLQVISCSLCTILGEWLCQRRECAEIPLSQPKPNNNNRRNGSSKVGNDDQSTSRLLEV